MKKSLLFAAALCVTLPQAGLAGSAEEAMIDAPVIVEDTAASASMPGKTLVVLSALVVFVTAAMSAN